MPRSRRGTRLPRAILFTAVTLSALAMATPSKAAQKESLGSVSCENWDCEGGIICSCCKGDSCYICDVGWQDGEPYPITTMCERAATGRGANAATAVPGGGVFDSGSGQPPRRLAWNDPPAPGGAVGATAL